jgi:hypothetical protein
MNAITIFSWLDTTPIWRKTQEVISVEYPATSCGDG